MKRKFVSKMLATVTILNVVLAAGVVQASAQEATTFSQDFENPKYQQGTIQYGNVYLFESSNTSANKDTQASYIKNISQLGGFASHTAIYADGDLITNQYDASGVLQKQSYGMRWNSVEFANTAKTGGWPMEEGWGFNSANLPGYGWEAAPVEGMYLTDLSVQTKDGSHALLLAPSKINTYLTIGDAYSSFFGRDNISVMDKITKISARVNVVQEGKGSVKSTNTDTSNSAIDGFRLHLVKNGYFEHANWLDNGMGNQKFLGDISQFLRKSWSDSDPKANWYDALIWDNKNIYMGSVAEENKVCAYTEGAWYTVDYYLDLRTPSAPKCTAVVRNADGTMAGSKTITYVGEATSIGSLRSCKDALTTFDAGSSYGFLYSASTDRVNNTWTNDRCQAYIDDITFGEVSAVDMLAASSVTKDDDTQAVTADFLVTLNDVGGLGATGNLIVAVYDKVTNRLLGINISDEITLTANEIKAGNRLNMNVEESTNGYSTAVYFWDDMTTIKPLANPVYSIK